MYGVTPLIMSYNAYNLSALVRSQSGVHPHQPFIVILLIFTMPETQSKTRHMFQTHLCPGLEPHPPTACLTVGPMTVSQPEFQRIGEYWTSLKLNFRSADE